MVKSRRVLLRRSLGPGLTALTGILAFGLIAGLVAATATVAGLPRQWAFAIGWIVGFAALVGRQTIRATPDTYPWRAAFVQLAFMSAVTVAVTWVVGARIFAAAP
jgi:hypothetical protein